MRPRVNRGDIERRCRALGIRYGEPNHEGWAELATLCPNPEHHDRNSGGAGINLNSGVVHCFICNFSASVFQLGLDAGAPPEPLPTDESASAVAGTPTAADPCEAMDPSEAPRAHPEVVMEGRAGVWDDHPFDSTEERLAGWQARLINGGGNTLLELAGIKRGTAIRLGIGVGSGEGSLTQDCFADYRLMIPVRSKEGELLGCWGYRPDAPERTTKCLPLRQGQKASLWGMDHLSFNPQSVLICEGFKDAIIARQNGFEAVTGTNGSGTWRPEWSEQLLAAGPVDSIYVVYDHDQAGATGALRVAEASWRVGISTLIARWPDDSPEKFDLADWFAQGRTVSDFEKTVLKTAMPFEPESVLVESFQPMCLAQAFLDHFRYGTEYRLKVWRGQWFLWRAGTWSPLSRDGINSAIWKTASKFYRLQEKETKAEDGTSKIDFVEVFFRPNLSSVTGIESAARALAFLEDRVEQPCWLSGDGPDPRFILPVRNGILDIKAWQAGEPCLLPQSPRYFSLGNRRPYHFDPNATCTLWDRFLSEVLEDDADRVELIEELMGYWLTGDTSFQQIAVFKGGGRNGKGALTDTVVDLIGRDLCQPVELAGLSNEHALSPLVGKRLAVASDAHFGKSHFSDEQRVLGVVKAISGEDTVTVNPKYRDAFQARLSVRFLLCCNEWPQLQDNSHALLDRLIVVPFDVRFEPESRDRHLREKLKQELPGILNRALAGWKRLEERGYFDPPATCRAAKEVVASLLSPIRAFANEHCELRPEANVELDELYQIWVQWCTSIERKPGAKAEFARTFCGAFRDVKEGKRGPRGSQVKVITGVALVNGKEAAPPLRMKQVI